MRKSWLLLGLLLAASPVSAAITVNTVPTSLVTSLTNLPANIEKAVFEFALTADASETLSSVAVTVNSSTAVSGDLNMVAVYKDDGDNAFDSGDMLAGSTSTVNVGSSTSIATTSNNSLTGGKYFVTLKSAAGWSGTDSVTVTLNTNGITTSANSPVSVSVTTLALSADTTGPALTSAVAVNKDGSSAGLEAGDKLVLTFNEATNKPTITASNIASTLMLNNSHVWLDGVASIGGAVWNDAGTVLTVTLSGGTSLPTLAVGDTVTISGTAIMDASNNNATGTVTITGSFSAPTGGEDEEDPARVCAGAIVNGRLYKLAGAQNTTVYLAAGCRLKPFRGAAVFHARGHKFVNIIQLSSLAGIEVSDKPALPAGGTLVKGSDATVWFVTKSGKKKGFVSAESLTRLGFRFRSVHQISDSDLNTMETDSAITPTQNHPEGTLARCGNSFTVFEVKSSNRFPFTNADAFLNRGHSWDHIVVIDCGRFAYNLANNINQ